MPSLRENRGPRNAAGTASAWQPMQVSDLDGSVMPSRLPMASARAVNRLRNALACVSSRCQVRYSLCNTPCAGSWLELLPWQLLPAQLATPRWTPATAADDAAAAGQMYSMASPARMCRVADVSSPILLLSCQA